MKKLLITGIAASLTLLAVACGGGGGDEETATPAGEATTAPVTAAPATVAPATAEPVHEEGPTISIVAASGTMTVDGDNSDWAAVEGTAVSLEQIEIPPGVDWDEPGALSEIEASVKVATDAQNIYVLLEIPGDYAFDPADAHRSASVAVMFRIDEAAGPHMGAVDEDLEAGLGMVDIWHWELDCAAGQMSGGGGVAGGDDAKCNFDDEYANDPEDREDDGKGDVANATGENSLAGVWKHTASDQGAGAAGTWIFEMSRPLKTGDSQDAQFASPGMAAMALAFWDPSETSEGWTDNGHLQSSENGWLDVILP